MNLIITCPLVLLGSPYHIEIFQMLSFACAEPIQTQRLLIYQGGDLFRESTLPASHRPLQKIL